MYQQPESSNLIGWKLEVGVASYFFSAWQGFSDIAANIFKAQDQMGKPDFIFFICLQISEVPRPGQTFQMSTHSVFCCFFFVFFSKLSQNICIRYSLEVHRRWRWTNVEKTLCTHWDTFLTYNCRSWSDADASFYDVWSVSTLFEPTGKIKVLREHKGQQNGDTY